MAPVPGPATSFTTVFCLLASFGTWRYSVRPVPQGTTVEEPLGSHETIVASANTDSARPILAASAQPSGSSSSMNSEADLIEEAKVSAEAAEQDTSSDVERDGIVMETQLSMESEAKLAEVAEVHLEACVQSDVEQGGTIMTRQPSMESEPAAVHVPADVQDCASDVELSSILMGMQPSVEATPDLVEGAEVYTQAGVQNSSTNVERGDTLIATLSQNRLVEDAGSVATLESQLAELVAALQANANDVVAKVKTLSEDWIKRFPWKAEEFMGFAVVLDIAIFVLFFFYYRCRRRNQIQPESPLNEQADLAEDGTEDVNQHAEREHPVEEAALLEDLSEDKEDEKKKSEVDASPSAMMSSDQTLGNLPTPTRNSGPRMAVHKSEEEVRQRMSRLRAQCEVLDESQGSEDSKPTSPAVSAPEQRAVPKKTPTKSWAEIQGRMQELQQSCKVFSEADDGLVTTHSEVPVSLSGSNVAKSSDDQRGRRSVPKTEAEVRAKMAARRAQCEVLGEGVGTAGNS